MAPHVTEDERLELIDLSNKIMDMANLAMAAAVFGQFNAGLNLDIPTIVTGIIITGSLYALALWLRQKARR